MNKRGDTDTTTLTLGFLVVGALIGVIFASAGGRAGSLSFTKNELYSKDVSLLTSSLLSLPPQTDVVLTYPHDFQDYTLTYQDTHALITSQQKETFESKQPYLDNKNYEMNLPAQENGIHYTKLGEKLLETPPK